MKRINYGKVKEKRLRRLKKGLPYWKFNWLMKYLRFLKGYEW